MADLPTYLNPEVGYALYWLTHTERGVVGGPEIIERLLARGYVADRAEARAVLRQARADVTATARIHGASTGQSLRSACDYKCADDTKIALRILYTATDERGNPVGPKSIVVNGTAGENVRDVLNRAASLANQVLHDSDKYRGMRVTVDRPFDVGDIDQVLLNYSEGRV